MTDIKDITQEDIAKVVAEFNSLAKRRKEIKVFAKEAGIKLVSVRGKKERIPQYDELLSIFSKEIYNIDILVKIDQVFKNTISLEKPQGQKWVVFTLEGNYSFAILNNSIKAKKNE